MSSFRIKIGERAISEALRYKVADKTEALWEAVSIMWSLRELSPGNSDLLGFTTTRTAVVRRLYYLWEKASLLKESFGSLNSYVKVPREHKGNIKLIGFNKSVVYNLYEGLEENILKLKYISCVLRAIFLSCGYLLLPRWGYDLELRLPYKKRAFLLYSLLRSRNFTLGIRNYRNRWYLYIRNQADVSGFMAICGLGSTSLKIEEVSLMRSTKNRINKQVNCDSANIKRSIEASERQIKLIKKIKDSNYWCKLPLEVRQLAELRLENPQATFSELGVMLDKPVTKSTVKYRFNKLFEFCKKHDIV